ncbi:MAG: PaaI family thioesterase [Armatimonadota bacterium]|nr:PaaI family thioesterase [Armatimonadota bacterium]MDR5702434.1 PaaI family thioesterase [Armatimonadota bacterium]MDR7434327.1 PaaI family thioesterase [Armatimonadota bacterium]
MDEMAIQDFYPDELNYCYGCGQLNADGLKLRSFWIGEEAVAQFTPRSYHTAIPGYVYGGLIASLIDCHSTATAAAASYQAEGREMGTEPPFRFVTASLHVDYLRPVPMGVVLEIRGRVKELKGRKAVVQSEVFANDEVCARGEVVVVQLPEHMVPKKS